MNPSERAASACPTGTVLMPPRTASQTNAAPNAARQTAAEVNSEKVNPMSGSPNTTSTSNEEQRHVAQHFDVDRARHP